MGRRKVPRHRDSSGLELSREALTALIDAAKSRVVDHIETLPSQPLHRVAGGKKLAASLKEPAPARGAPAERLLKQLFGRVIPASLNTASPGYLAYIPGGGLPEAAVADMIALATNRYVGVWQAAPALVRLEQNVLEWFASWVGLPTEAGGLLTSGGSIANLVAIITARKERLPANFLRGVLYTSSEAHHSVAKAASLAGFPEKSVVTVPVDRHFRMDLRALEAAIAASRAEGATPFMIVANAGSTHTGAVDPLAALARIARREELWLHVDAAYGGFFVLTERGKRALDGIERADSVTLDPHKGLFMPYGTGCLLVRDGDALRRTHSARASYMPPMQDDPDCVDFCELGPELSRDARGLRVWFALKLHGTSAFATALDEKLDLAEEACRQLRSLPNIEIVKEPDLSLFAFRHVPPALRREASLLEGHNRRLLAAINAKQRVFLTGATAGGVFFVRVAILSFRTHRERVDALVEDVTLSLREMTPSDG